MAVAAATAAAAVATVNGNGDCGGDEDEDEDENENEDDDGGGDGDGDGDGDRDGAPCWSVAYAVRVVGACVRARARLVGGSRCCIQDEVRLETFVDSSGGKGESLHILEGVPRRPVSPLHTAQMYAAPTVHVLQLALYEPAETQAGEKEGPHLQLQRR